MAGVVAVVVVLALAATFVAVRTSTSDEVALAPSTIDEPAASSDPDPTTTDLGPDPSTPAGGGASADLEAEVADISRFVERERGLTFDEPVAVTSLGAEDFRARVLEEFEAEREILESEGALLRAGGIVPADTDMVQSQLDLLGDGVLGFYDPTSGELVVRRDSTGPLVRSVIAHELTHALEDQHFDLDRPELAERHDGSDWAFLALVEGSAKRVENAYLAQLSPEEQDQLAADQMQLALDQMDTLVSSPLVLAQILMAPYDYGAPFVDELMRAGGRERLDAAFAAPPTSSEQILEPTRFDGDRPVTVAAPPAEGEVIDEGVLGQLLTGFLVAEPSALDDLLGGIDPGQLDDLLDDLGLEDLQDLLDDLDRGAPGGSPSLPDPGGLGDGLGGTSSGFPPVATTPDWGGDRYVVWQDGAQVCLRADWVMDTPDALTTFRGVLAAWADRDPAVAVTEPTPDTARITRCA